MYLLNNGLYDNGSSLGQNRPIYAYTYNFVSLKSYTEVFKWIIFSFRFFCNNWLIWLNFCIWWFLYQSNMNGHIFTYKVRRLRRPSSSFVFVIFFGRFKLQRYVKFSEIAIHLLEIMYTYCTSMFLNTPF